MIFNTTALQDAYVIELEPYQDERGFFARSWCVNEFKDHGLNPQLVQCNVSYNAKAGTMRGMHYQAAPHEEAKLVRCTSGAIFDVIIDVRRDSPSFLKHVGVELSAKNRLMLYVPEGFAHGFLTLQDETEVFYQMTEFYVPRAARGFRWNDPAFDIDWSAEVKVISKRDSNYPDLDVSDL